MRELDLLDVVVGLVERISWRRLRGWWRRRRERYDPRDAEQAIAAEPDEVDRLHIAGLEKQISSLATFLSHRADMVPAVRHHYERVLEELRSEQLSLVAARSSAVVTGCEPSSPGAVSTASGDDGAASQEASCGTEDVALPWDADGVPQPRRRIFSDDDEGLSALPKTISEATLSTCLGEFSPTPTEEDLPAAPRLWPCGLADERAWHGEASVAGLMVLLDPIVGEVTMLEAAEPAVKEATTTTDAISAR